MKGLVNSKNIKINNKIKMYTYINESVYYVWSVTIIVVLESYYIVNIKADRELSL